MPCNERRFLLEQYGEAVVLLQAAVRVLSQCAGESSYFDQRPIVREFHECCEFSRLRLQDHKRQHHCE